MSTRLGKMVERLGGQLTGDPEIEVSGIAPLDEAGASHITFLSNSKFRTKAAQTGAAALILSPADDVVVSADYKGARIVTDNPYAYFARAAQFFVELAAVPVAPGIHASATVHANAKVSPKAVVGPHVTIGAGAIISDDAVLDAGCFIGRNAKVGAGTHLYANVSFHAECEIGERGIIHSGAVIGADGF